MINDVRELAMQPGHEIVGIELGGQDLRVDRGGTLAAAANRYRALAPVLTRCGHAIGDSHNMFRNRVVQRAVRRACGVRPARQQGTILVDSFARLDDGLAIKLQGSAYAEARRHQLRCSHCAHLPGPGRVETAPSGCTCSCAGH